MNATALAEPTSETATFDPVLYSDVELHFLLEHAGEPPVVAMQKGLPPGVNPNAIRPVLAHLYEFVELEKHQGQHWIGVEKVKQAIRVYLEQQAAWKAMRKRGAPRFPPMFSYDQRGRAHRYGPGSDGGQVKTWIDAEGKRHVFAIDLYGERADDGAWVAPWATGVEAPAAIAEHAELPRIECTIPGCGHTESYNPESASSRNLAKGRMKKHLMNPKNNVELHRELHTNEYGS